MSGRHQNTTWRALDPAVLDGLRAARSHVDTLTDRLAAIPANPDANAAHCEEVWRRGVPEIVRPYVLFRFLRADPARWTPLVAAAIQEIDAGPLDAYDVDDAFCDLATQVELWSVPEAYGVLLYVSPGYARRFACPAPNIPGAEALLEAFGGEPDPDEPDLMPASSVVPREPTSPYRSGGTAIPEQPTLFLHSCRCSHRTPTMALGSASVPMPCRPPCSRPTRRCLDRRGGPWA